MCNISCSKVFYLLALNPISYFEYFPPKNYGSPPTGWKDSVYHAHNLVNKS